MKMFQIQLFLVTFCHTITYFSYSNTFQKIESIADFMIFNLVGYLMFFESWFKSYKVLCFPIPMIFRFLYKRSFLLFIIVSLLT